MQRQNREKLTQKTAKEEREKWGPPKRSWRLDWFLFFLVEYVSKQQRLRHLLKAVQEYDAAPGPHLLFHQYHHLTCLKMCWNRHCSCSFSTWNQLFRFHCYCPITNHLSFFYLKNSKSPFPFKNLWFSLWSNWSNTLHDSPEVQYFTAQTIIKLLAAVDSALCSSDSQTKMKNYKLIQKIES